MTREELQIALRKLLPNDVQSSLFSEQTRFSEDLGFDSLDFLEYEVKLQDALNTILPSDFLDGVSTVGNLLDRLEQFFNQSKEVNPHGMQQNEGQRREEKIILENPNEGVLPENETPFLSQQD